MDIRFKKRHDHRIHDDTQFEDWLRSLIRGDARPLPTHTELPHTSGRALRGLLLNAPYHDPRCATPTFEFVARHYSIMRLWSVYHGCVKGDPASQWEVSHQVNAMMVTYHRQSMTVTALTALLYVLVSAERTWLFNGGGKDDVRAAIADIASTLLDAIARFRAQAASGNPIRFTYIDVVDDSIVCILNRPTLATYLREGGDWADITAQVEQGRDSYPKLSHAVFVD